MALQDWIAGEKELSTEVVQPIYIDHELLEELIDYHPTEPSLGICRLRLILSTDKKSVLVGDVRGNWHDDWVGMLKNLQFEETTEGKHTFLEDARRQPGQFGVSAWQVTNWRIVRSSFPNGNEVFQELIRWQNKDGKTAFSTYAWLPYKPN